MATMTMLAVASTLGGNATLAAGLACCMLWFFGGRGGGDDAAG